MHCFFWEMICGLLCSVASLVRRLLKPELASPFLSHRYLCKVCVKMLRAAIAFGHLLVGTNGVNQGLDLGGVYIPSRADRKVLKSWGEVFVTTDLLAAPDCLFLGWDREDESQCEPRYAKQHLHRDSFKEVPAPSPQCWGFSPTYWLMDSSLVLPWPHWGQWEVLVPNLLCISWGRSQNHRKARGRSTFH